MKSLATSELSLTLSLDIVRPATEKTCSDGADVAGMHNNCATKWTTACTLFIVFPPY